MRMLAEKDISGELLKNRKLELAEILKSSYRNWCLTPITPDPNYANYAASRKVSGDDL